jgi:hypothetical protein
VLIEPSHRDQGRAVIQTLVDDGARRGAEIAAREPVERRPTIKAWLPPGFVSPQVTIVAAAPSTTVIGVRVLPSTTTTPPFSADDILYWRNDVF